MKRFIKVLRIDENNGVSEAAIDSNNIMRVENHGGQTKIYTKESIWLTDEKGIISVAESVDEIYKELNS